MRRNLWISLVFVLGLAIGQLVSNAPLPGWAPSTALARGQGLDGTLVVGDGTVFVSTDGPNAYLWERRGDRVVLLGECSKSAAGEPAQATFVWRPGVERRQ